MDVIMIKKKLKLNSGSRSNFEISEKKNLHYANCAYVNSNVNI